MIRNLTLYILLLIFTLSSCSSSDELGSQKDVKSVPLVLGGKKVSNLESLQSNAISGSIEGSSLPGGLEYGVYVLDEDGNVMSNADNVKVVNGSDGTGTPAHSIYINEDDDVKVYAYYPYSADSTWNVNDRNGIVIYQENPVLDELWAINTDAGYSGTEVPVFGTDPHAHLLFHHIKSRLVFNFHIDESNDLEYKNFNYTLHNVYTQSDYDISKQAFNDEGIAGDVNMEIGENLSYSNPVKSKCLILPMPLNISWQVMLEVSFTQGDSVYTLSAPVLMPEGQGWISGNSYMYDVTAPSIQSPEQDLIISNCTIIPWNENELDEIELTEEEKQK